MKNEAQYYRELGQRIQRARLRQQLTQENLASLVGLSRTSVVNIERGRQKVLAHVLVRLAHALHMELSDLAQESKEDFKIEELLQHLPESTQAFVRSAVGPGKSKG
ncbi:MAG: helix-turn-helix transcriptional regulator [Acidimicrobiaceae bacterium]|nr:helix-turn-helix transcriptional regulator [Acidimicrobiaceae bacterium]